MSAPTTFGHAQIDACLDVLGACVLTDRLQRDEELVELSNSAQIIAREVAPEHVVSRRDVIDWFEAHRERLADIAKDTDRSRTALGKVEGDELQKLTLACIYAISVCDYQLADEESAFIRLALETWTPDGLSAEHVAVLD